MVFCAQLFHTHKFFSWLYSNTAFMFTLLLDHWFNHVQRIHHSLQFSIFLDQLHGCGVSYWREQIIHQSGCAQQSESLVAVTLIELLHFLLRHKTGKLP